MSRARHILAVVAVTTALCADQAVSAAPVTRPQATEIAARLVDRLSRPFRHSVPAVVSSVVPSSTAPAPATVTTPPPARVPALNCELSPFQFRLPPPAR